VRIALVDEVDRGLATRYFDAKDLLPPREMFVGDSWLPGPSPTEQTEPFKPTRIPTEEDLLDLIRDAVGRSGTWEAPAALQVRNRIVIAHNDLRTLDEVAAFLDALHAELDATGDLRPYLKTRRWSTVTGAPPRTVQR
jgi:hypothetical protein